MAAEKIWVIDFETLLVYPSLLVFAFTGLPLHRALPMLVVVEGDLEDTVPIHLSGNRLRAQRVNDGMSNVWN